MVADEGEQHGSSDGGVVCLTASDPPQQDSDFLVSVINSSFIHLHWYNLLYRSTDSVDLNQLKNPCDSLSIPDQPCNIKEERLFILKQLQNVHCP